MKVNSSSNASLSPPGCFINSSVSLSLFICIEKPISSTMFKVFTFTEVLVLLPLYILILCLGLQGWRRQRSVAAGAPSHSDVITYHMVTVEILGVLGWVLYISVLHNCNLAMPIVGYYFLSITYPGQTFFHCLTCMEHYLAVVHPITYLGLRTGDGVKVRNIAIGCVWLLNLGMTGLTALCFPDFPAVLCFTMIAFSLSFIIFCSLSALRTLIRLGLGKVGGVRERIDQSKQRAFHTILAIMGTLILRLCGQLVSAFMFNLESDIGVNGCQVLIFSFWLCLPSSFVLPLLFLQRAGKLACSGRSEN